MHKTWIFLVIDKAEISVKALRYPSGAPTTRKSICQNNQTIIRDKGFYSSKDTYFSLAGRAGCFKV
jgi:hypothetical protein